MRTNGNVVGGDDSRTDLEDTVFAALGELYSLPTHDAVEAAGFVAGQIAAFLADTARLSANRASADHARATLAELHDGCSELLRDLTEAPGEDAAKEQGGSNLALVFSGRPASGRA